MTQELTMEERIAKVFKSTLNHIFDDLMDCDCIDDEPWTAQALADQTADYINSENDDLEAVKAYWSDTDKYETIALKVAGEFL